jgi:hypothetical protein
MNGLKHMMIAVAMLLAVAPCSHGEDHGKHIHDSGARAEICASHPCSCHACDTTSECADDLDIQLQQASAATPGVLSTSTLHLFTLAETRPVITDAPHSVGGVLAFLQTVQLLI